MTFFVSKRKKVSKEPQSLEKAYDYALFLLSLHLRTVGEILKRMRDRGFAEALIGQVIERLKEQKYLDDRRYAEIFLENLKTYRNFGYYGIKKKMILKKLPASLIDEILTKGLSAEEETKIAKRLLEKEGYAVGPSGGEKQSNTLLYQTFGDGEQNKKKSKIANRLKSRGFRADIIAELLY